MKLVHIDALAPDEDFRITWTTSNRVRVVARDQYAARMDAHGYKAAWIEVDGTKVYDLAKFEFTFRLDECIALIRERKNRRAVQAAETQAP